VFDFDTKVVFKLVAGKCSSSPIAAWSNEAKRVVEHAISCSGFIRSKTPGHVANTIDFDLIGGFAKAIDDPDYNILRKYHAGVNLGYLRRMPRSPAVFARKTRWAKQVGDVDEWSEKADIYRSAIERPEVLWKTFDEQLALNMSKFVPLKEAQRLYGHRLRIAALGAFQQGVDDWRVIHDGAGHFKVNSGIRIRGQEIPPLASDAVAMANSQRLCGSSSRFVLLFDVSEARRRIGVEEEDGGLQACQPFHEPNLPLCDQPIWLNTVSTYRFGSASYWWGRFGVMVVRLTYSRDYGSDGPSALAIASGAHVARPLFLMIVLLEAMEVL
jgi:hypothetical protein